MKLDKAIRQKTGVDVSHWRIRKISINPDQLKASIMVEGYLDEAAYTAGAESIVAKTIDIDVESNKVLTNLLDAIQTKVLASLS